MCMRLNYNNINQIWLCFLMHQIDKSAFEKGYFRMDTGPKKKKQKMRRKISRKYISTCRRQWKFTKHQKCMSIVANCQFA